MQRVRSVWGCVALAALLISSQGVVIFGGRTLLPIAPSNGVLPHVPYAYQGPVSDGFTTADPEGALNVGYAFDAYAAAALARGSVPLWNPHQGLGQPFLANPLSAVLYPPNWLHLVLPHAWWDLVYLLNLFLAAAFLYAWLRLADVELLPALVGSAAVLANGYFQMYLALREVVAAAAWWPLLLCGVEVALRRPRWPLRHVLLALPVYCTISAGQPEVTFFSLLAVTIFGLVRVAARGRDAAQALVAIAPGTAAGLLLAAPMWLNFVDYAFAAYSMHPVGSWYGDLHMPHASLGTFFFPYLYGRLHTDPFGPIEGYLWNLSPGWLPALALFLGLRALWLGLRRPRVAVTFFAALALGIAAKSWGLPGVQALGRLPIIEMLIFPRYAGFLLIFSLAILAAHGARDLAQLEAHRWRGWVVAWLALVVGVWVAGVQPLWPSLRGGGPTQTEAEATLLTFGGLGLAWSVLAPLALWWLRARRPDQALAFHCLAGLGILLQGVAHAPNGHRLATFASASATALACYVGFALALGTLRRCHPRVLVASGLAAVLLASLLPGLFSFRGLPTRHDPLAEAPYLQVLASLQEGNLYRSYSLDGMPQPNFAMPFEISSLNNIEALIPSWSAQFSTRYLDQGVDPLFFGGNHSTGRDPRHPAAGELLRNGRWFDLVGVRAVSARRGHPAAFFAGQLVPTYADATGVEIWVRPRALPRVFLAPSARVAASWEEALARLEETADPSRTVWIEEPPEIEGDGAGRASPGRVLSFRLEPNDVWIEYEAATRGILVLTDAWAEGWRAALDGREVPVLRVDGVFRGVRLDAAGTHRVHLQYRPPLWGASLALAGLGALILLVAPFVRSSKARRRREIDATVRAATSRAPPGSST